MKSSDAIFSTLYSEAREEFRNNRRIMSFGQFVEAFLDQPERFARNSVQYLRDCIRYFGEEHVETPRGQHRRFQLFDMEFEEGRGRLVGQLEAQQRVYNLLNNFAREGRVNKLILLHGPNGSAKSTFIGCLLRSLEHYSATDEGALYRFSWIFPNERIAGSSEAIGFGGFTARTAEKSKLDSFAFLEDEEIDAKISSDLRDHPLLLLPQDFRQRLLAENIDQMVKPGSLDVDDSLDEHFVASHYILRGDLSHSSRQIFDALLTAYRGDLEKVLKHVQVERFYISRRYRVGAITVGPQLRVDASLRQLTVDRSLGALPTSLQNQTIIEPFGDLVDANRGVIEYDDLFKRHPDMNKYLLATSEKGSVKLENRIVFLDMMLLATGNETYLDAFKQTADWPSFKGRLELVRVGYLRDYDTESEIYEDHLRQVPIGKAVAPHTAYVAALWAVLTRLRRPDPDNFSGSLREVIKKLSPIEKADLYARGKTPDWCTGEQSRELKQAIAELLDETAGTSAYEGRFGASPREMKVILLDASQDESLPTLSPLAVFRKLEQLVADPSVFPFLQMSEDGEYRRPGVFIQTVRERYLDIVDDEVQSAMGLVEEDQYDELFRRYIDHLSQSLKGEKVFNQITKNYEDPDRKMMERVEEILGVEGEADEHRQSLIGSIAAWSIDHPGEKMSYKEIFPNLFASLRRSFFEERQNTIRKIQSHMMDYFEDRAGSLSKSEREAVELTLENMRERHGYREESAREAIAFLLSERYKES